MKKKMYTFKMMGFFLPLFFISFTKKKEHSEKSAHLEYGNKVTTELILKTEENLFGQKLQWPQYENSEVTILKIIIPPGSSVPWHLHTMPMFAYLIQGTVEIELENGNSLLYKSGQALAEARNVFHRGKNTSKEDVILMVTYIGERGRPLAVPRP